MKMPRLIPFLLILLFAACTRSETVTLSNGEEGEVSCLPIYGNWCGEGYPAYLETGFKPKSVDVWDEACRQHDFCYDYASTRPEVDSLKENCDQSFTRRIESLYDRGYPVPRAMNAAYAFFNQKIIYHNNLITGRDVQRAVEYSCRGGDGQAALFCDVGMGRDDCELDTVYYAEHGKCYCDYGEDIWSETTRKWGDRVYSATK